jgi:hypothetical protein
MKTKLVMAILLSFIGLNSNLNAQSIIPAANLQHSTSLYHIRLSLEKGGLNTSYINSVMNMIQSLNQQTSDKRSLIQKNDSVFKWKWNVTGKVWYLSCKEISIVYDANNNLTSYILKSWNGTNWMDSAQYTNTYDANNNLTINIIQIWNGTAWINNFKETYTYNANKKVTSDITQNWNGTVWVNSFKNSYNYDTKNNCSDDLGQEWIGSAWVNAFKGTYTYDSKNNMLTATYQTWKTTAWLYSYKYTFTYDANNNKLTYLEQYWDVSAWTDEEKSNCTYDANNNLILELIQSWDGSNWVNFNKDSYTYDAKDNKTSYLLQIWDGSIWINSYKETHTYDVNNFTVTDAYITWNPYAYKVVQGDSNYYYLHTTVGINDVKQQEGSTYLYPNPTTGKFTINSSIKFNSIEIYNLTGELIYSDSYSSGILTSAEIDLSNYQKGIYFVWMMNDNGAKVHTEKIILE